MKKYCIINPENTAVINKLKEYGYICIPTEKSTDVSRPISLHADVLYLKADNKTIYISECQKNNIELLKKLGYAVKTVKLSPGYKTESKLNFVITDDMILCNPKTCIDISEISENKDIIYTNQGYTKCSTIFLGNNNFITEDESVCEALSKADKKCLLIEKGHVRLDGYEYGFIGGASVYLEREKTVIFAGNISKHNSYKLIEKFCSSCGITVDSVDENDLCDIGGVVII